MVLLMTVAVPPDIVIPALPNGPVFPLMVLFVRLRLASMFWIPPANAAEFQLMVLLLTVVRPYKL